MMMAIAEGEGRGQERWNLMMNDLGFMAEFFDGQMN